MITRLFMRALPVLVGLAILLAINQLEFLLYPVIKHFAVTKITPTSTGVIISGYMTKARNCAFLGLAATTQNGDELGVRFPEAPTVNATLPTGTQNWGPWQIYMPLQPAVQTITIKTYHDCHPFWSSRSTLLNMSVQRVSE